ncbi:unnamed protein product [Cladocopium goreaui]|uniref:Apple domain-containing protein n=1 Tax=Cladocopium goreaui TaxID=2562237 RepID=A0A9P1CSK6_9DINO|nr:unnamed protein product [Cladocopium goreaui]
MEDSLCEAVEPFQGGGEPYDAQCAFRIGCRNAFSHYEGFCKDFRNRDVMADPVPDAVESLEACQAACRADDGCEGVEWYPDTQGWQNHKCHKFPGTPGSGGSSSMQVVQGGGDYLDAQCYVRHCFGGVARLRNDRWQHFTGYCRDRSGTDVQGNPVNLSETLEACQSVCSEDLSCEAIVWYPETRGYGEVKCWRYPPAPGSTHSGRGDSTEMPSQGGGNYLDAQCYLRFGPDSFTHFDGFCTDRDGVDVMADAVPSAESLGACQAVCLLNESCTGIEWYPGSGGWQNHKCHKFPGTPGSGGSSSLPVVQGGGDYLDAQCYVRPHSGAAVSISVPGCRVNGCQRSAGTL